jgi:hypothetical protein
MIVFCNVTRRGGVGGRGGRGEEGGGGGERGGRGGKGPGRGGGWGRGERGGGSGRWMLQKTSRIESNVLYMVGSSLEFIIQLGARSC